MFIFRKKISLCSKKVSLHNCFGVSVFIAAVCCMFFIFPITSYAGEVFEVAQVQGNSMSKEIYHRHVGNSEEIGGCYTVRKERVEGPCPGTIKYKSEGNISVCDVCGYTFIGDLSGKRCSVVRPGDRIVYYYELGCGKTEQSCVGVLHVSKSTNEWTKSLVLTASYEVRDGLQVREKAYIWNESEPCTSDTYEVTQNGRYSIRLNTDAYSDGESARIDIDVNNIDVSGPGMLSYSKVPNTGWTKEKVVVAIARTNDLQPDGREGCGLHNTPYSFDNGSTWTDSPLCTYDKNGTYVVKLRDKIGNQSSHNIVISNIDITPPKVNLEYDRTNNLLSVEVNVWANDLQPDNTNGAGLHELAYSFDNGNTWTNKNTIRIERNTTLNIAVRDLLGNVSYLEEKIGNIDTRGPKINYTMNSVSWTNKDVELSLSATDMNADGSEGCGLPDKWYSVDDGMTWTDEAVRVIEKNQVIHILARDKNNNKSKITIRVNQIDRELPQILLSAMKVKENGEKKVRLSVIAFDSKSGLDENAFSWDEGNTFSKETGYDVTKNGNYTVCVRDKAGNIAKSSIYVDTFRRQNGKEDSNEENKGEDTQGKEGQEGAIPEGEENGSDTQDKDNPDDEKNDEEQNDEESNGEELPEEEKKKKQKLKIGTALVEQALQSPNNAFKKEIKENEEKNVTASGEESVKTHDSSEIFTEETLVVMEEAGDKPEVTEEKRVRKNKVKRVVTTVVSGTVIVFAIGVIFLLLYIKYRIIRVYVYDNKNEKTFLDFKWIRHSGEHYMVEISQECLEECMTGRFCFYPDTFFVKNHSAEEIYFLFPEKVCITHKISEKMEITLY